MAVGAADPELYKLAAQYDGAGQPVQPGGLANLDVTAASRNLANVGQPPIGTPASAPVDPQAPPWTPIPGQPAPTPSAPSPDPTVSAPPQAPQLRDKFSVAGDFPGMLSPGNVDLTNRPDVANADGSHSSVRSMSFEENGKEILVPTVSEDGRIMSDDEAIAQYHKTGRNLGVFADPAAATAYANTLHEQQAGAMHLGPPGGASTPTGNVAATVPDQAPAPPPLTGNPEQDSRNNLEWQRALQQHYGRREAAVIEKASGINAQKAEQEAALAKQEATARQAAARRDEERRAAVQAQVTASVDERAAAHKDLEGANWADKNTGRAIFLTIAGAIAQSLDNVGAAYLGQVGHAQNEGNVAIDRLMKADYEKKKARLDAASDSLIEARHGLADAATNRLASQNDLDAEFAAKYKLIGKDAEEQLRRAGASDADIKANAIVANAAQQQAKFEGQIIDREAQRADTREGHAATTAMAGAHLALSERTAKATETMARMNFGEKQREFDLKLAEKRQADADRAEAKAKEKKANAIPTVITDTLTGRDLPVDPTRTDARKHNAAVAGLPQVNGAIEILDKVLKDATKPHAPEFLSHLGMDTTAQAGVVGQMTRFRSAYAASKKESVGEANSHELAQAIPDPPTALDSAEAFKNWRRKIEDTRKELHDTRNGLLANAGVPPSEIKGGEAKGAPAAGKRLKLKDGRTGTLDADGLFHQDQ